MKLLFIIFVILICPGNFYPASGGNEEVEFFSKDALQTHLNYLGSDSLEGRGTGTMGGNLAAKYLASELKKLKIQPACENNSYYQYIPMHGSIPLPSSKLLIINGRDTINLNLKNDYLLYKGGEQTFVANPLQLVFVGYGIVAPEYDYNDYQAINVEGKIVIMLDGEPRSDDPAYFNGENPTIYSIPESKQRIAISRGARGSIIIPLYSPDWEVLKQSFSFEDVTLAYAASGNLSVLLNPASSFEIFKGSDYSLDEIYRMHLQNRIKSFPLNSSLLFNGYFRERDFVSPNIAAIVPGRDPVLKDTYILVTAHYDHLGIGPAIKGDSIYNGVFDNAIGTAALLELARAFVSLNMPCKRSVIFLFLTGEEKGLLGSAYYTANPLVPLYKTAAVVNIDGIALFDKFKSIIGIGSELSTIHKFLSETAISQHLSLTTIPRQFDDYNSFSKSDQISFALAGIPSVLVTEGADYENLSKEEGMEKLIHYSREIYHSPFDDLSQEMNFNAAIQHIKILYDLGHRLADSDEVPEWNTGTPYVNTRLRSQAEKR